MRADLPAPDSAAIFKSRRAGAQAKHLRRNMTAAERALWRQLRQLREPGLHFRRQTPFGPYVVDFLCHAARLVVEVDGGEHDQVGRADTDAERQAWIEGRGYKVLRFSNADVKSDVGRVSRLIAAEVNARKAVREA